MYRMATDKTARKVTVSSWVSAATAVILYFLKIQFFTSSPLPMPVETALGIVISGAIGYIMVFLAGYFTRPAKDDGVISDPGTQPAVSDPVLDH